MSTAADRLLGWVGIDDERDASARATAFRRFLLAEAAVHSWIVIGLGRSAELHGVLLPCAVALTAAAGAVFLPRFERPSLALAFATMLARAVWTFPDPYNHLVLELILCGAAALTLPRSPAEQRLLLQFARWMIVIVLFWSGLQKVLHGCYFQGQFLAFAVATHENFSMPFSVVFPQEVLRLRDLAGVLPGEGPYLVDRVLFVAISNLVWISELLLPIALVVRRTRTLALAASILFVLCVEVIARELVFGVLFVNGLLLFAPGNVYRKAFWPFMGILLGLLAAELMFPDAGLN